MNELTIRLMTTDMNVTDTISDTTSNQGPNSLILKINSANDTLLIEIESKGRPISGPPFVFLSTRYLSQVRPRTLLTLAPTLRIETIAATAIRDTIRTFHGRGATHITRQPAKK